MRTNQMNQQVKLESDAHFMFTNKHDQVNMSKGMYISDVLV